MKVLTMLLLFLPMLYAQAATCVHRFDDAQLEVWLKRQNRGLILVVSDGMPYSQRAISDVRAAAKKRRLELLVLSDRVGKGQSERCDALVSSEKLISKGALRHFPTLFMVKGHSISERVVPGIQTPQELELNLNEVL